MRAFSILPFLSLAAKKRERTCPGDFLRPSKMRLRNTRDISLFDYERENFASKGVYTSLLEENIIVASEIRVKQSRAVIQKRFWRKQL